ncbi:hypothetical protein IFR05_017621, partial [Cadophora sp. M221]
CSWESLYHLGHLLKSPGFMNFCIDGLRGLESVCDGVWPSTKEVKGVWEMDFDMDIRVGLGRDGLLSSDADSGSTETSSYLKSKNTPLHTFTASCIAYNAPLTTYPKDNFQYRNWSRLLGTNKSLSLAVHTVDAKRFAGKGPWSDEFRSMWKVQEEGLGEKWKG